MVGVRRAEPALFRLPARGQLLVNSRVGAWIVQPDGSKRLLHGWTSARWSPTAKYVVATRGHEVAALTPHGDVRWSLARRGRVTGASWSFEGFRVAYLNGTQLRLVIGNGEGDHMLVPRVRPVPPAWRPVGPAHVLAYVDTIGEARMIDADTGRDIGSYPAGKPEELAWSADGKLIVARSSGLLSVEMGFNMPRTRKPKQVTAPDGTELNTSGANVPGSAEGEAGGENRPSQLDQMRAALSHAPAKEEPAEEVPELPQTEDEAELPAHADEPAAAAAEPEVTTSPTSEEPRSLEVTAPSLMTVRPRIASSSMLTSMRPSLALHSSSARRSRLFE